MNTNVHVKEGKWSPSQYDYIRTIDGVDFIPKERAANIIEVDRSIAISENGEYTVEPSEGNDGFNKVTIEVQVPEKIIEPIIEETIDIETYTEPVTIAAAEDGVKDVVITLANIPDTSANRLYCWRRVDDLLRAPYIWTTFDTAPEDYEEQDPETGEIITVPGILDTDIYVTPINDVALRITKAPFANINGITDEFAYTCDSENNEIKFRGNDKDGHPIRVAYNRYGSLDIDLSYLMPERT